MIDHRAYKTLPGNGTENQVTQGDARPQCPPVLPGFEHMKRFWLPRYQRYAVKVRPGEHYVTSHDELLMTTLGSCITVCLRDPQTGLAGMNHFILPESSFHTEGSFPTESSFPTKSSLLVGHSSCVQSMNAGILSMSMRYGTFAMETLINDLLRAGASKQRLEAKVTGGGQVLGRHSMVGKNNIRFIRAFLQTEEVPVLSEDTGGGQPRRVIYIAREGRLLVRKLPVASMNRLMRMEEGYQESLNNSMDAADAELF